MKIIQAACLTLLALAGCSERESSSQDKLLPVQESPITTFKRVIDSGEDLVFTDTVEQGPGAAGESLKLRFSKDSKVTFEEFGYGIDIYPGAFTIKPGGDLTVIDQRARTIQWPTLILHREGDRLTLCRKDGLRSFKEHGNFWPEIVERVFPLKAKLPDKQNKAQMATPRKPSD